MSLHGQSPELPTGFGYADRTVDLGQAKKIGSTSTVNYFTSLIKLPDVGKNEITHISFVAHYPNDTYGQVVVLSEDATQVLYTQPCPIVGGVNKVQLTTPLATEAGKRYLVGYSVKPLSSQDLNPMAYDASISIEDADWIIITTEALTTPTPPTGNFYFNNIAANESGSALIFVSLRDPKAVANLAYPVKIQGSFSLANPGDVIAGELSVRNIGSNDIKTLELSYQYGDNPAKTISVKPAEAITAGLTAVVPVQIPAEVVGAGLLKCSVSKVNGVPQTFAAASCSIPYRINQNGAVKRQTILVERFSTELCGNCPAAGPVIDKMIARMQSEGYHVSYITHHSAFGTDPFTLPQSEEIVEQFFPASEMKAPAISLNRTYVPSLKTLAFVPSDTEFLPLFDEIKGVKEGAIINSISQRVVDGTLNITVGGIALQRAFDPADLFLTVIITEDDVKAIDQNGGKEGYKHHSLARKFLTAGGGQPIRPTSDGNFSVDLSCTIDREWIVDHCKVIAFAHHNIFSPEMTDRSIFTVREAPLGKDFILGCQEIAGVPAPTVSVHDGSLTIHGACDLVEVYGMDGTLITTDIATQLPAGIYIVKLYHELRSYTTKIVVR